MGRIPLAGGRFVTPVSWAFAPEWLTVPEASALSGYDIATIHWMIQDGAVDAKIDENSAYLVEKASLREFREALLEVVHWRD